jgi:putative endonuclease
VLARFMFAIINFAARKGLGATPSVRASSAQAPSNAAGDPAKHRARQTGVRGETYAYWYLRRHGYILIARNFTSPGIKGEIDMVGYDGQTLAFVEVKTRTVSEPARSSQSSARPAPLTPEEAVNWEKRRNLSRMARQFLRARHIETALCRFDVLAIETRPGQKPVVRLHKGAFNATQQQHPPSR